MWGWGPVPKKGWRSASQVTPSRLTQSLVIRGEASSWHAPRPCHGWPCCFFSSAWVFPLHPSFIEILLIYNICELKVDSVLIRYIFIVSDFIFLGSQITADGDRSHEIKRCLLLGRKVMANLDSIFKSRDITLPTKVCLVKAMVFPVVTYGCDNWTVKKAESWKIDAFELWCWRSLWESLGLQGDPTSPS